MRKDIKTNKVVKALAIGLAASMAMSQPISVMAESAPVDSNDGAEGAAVAEKAEMAKVEASTICDGAQAAVENAQEVVTDREVDGYLEVAGDSLNDAESDIVVANGTNAATNKMLDTAKDSAIDAKDVAADMEQIVEDTKTLADEKIDAIESATTIADANAANAELVEAVEEAEEKLAEKTLAYDAAKTAYDNALAMVEELQKAYDAAVKNADADAYAAAEKLQAAKDEADKLAKAAEQAEKEATDARDKAQVAKDEAQKALDAADKALGEAEKAQQDAAKAKDAVDKDATVQSGLAIAEKETLTSEDNGRVWENQDQLFVAIMQEYYLPEVKGIKGETSVVVKKFSGDDSKNYFTVTYVDEAGETQTVYYNYKMDDNGKSKDKIVIFEKRPVEVNGDPAVNPDQYVDEEGNVIALADIEKYINVDGTYYEANKATDSETLVQSSVITGTSTTDVTVSETKTETYKVTEDGTLVKEVTADVTTVTYTGATFTSDVEYATDEERDAAAAAKKAEIEKATGKDATVTETEETTTTYVATGTYIPTFTETVTVTNEEVEKGWTVWDEADSKGEAVEYVYDEKLGDKYDDDEKYYIISESNNMSVTGMTNGKWNDDSDYLVSGTASVTYAKVTKKTVNKDTFGAIWDDISSLWTGENANDKVEAKVREAIEAAGGIFVKANWTDWAWNEATVYYVEAVAVDGAEKESEAQAKDSLEDAAAAAAQAKGASGVYNVKSTTEKIDTTTYSYAVNYLEKSDETKESKVVATETYADAEVLTGQIVQNKHYVDGNIDLTQDDEAYRTFVDNAVKANTDAIAALEEANAALKDARELTQKAKDNHLAANEKFDAAEKDLIEAAELTTEAAKAAEAVLAAQEEVKLLQKAIAGMQGAADKEAELADLEAELKIAQDAKAAAEKAFEEVQERLDDALEELAKTIDRLTPRPADDDDDDEEEVVVETPVVVAEPAPVAVQQVVPVVDEPVVEIDEMDVPLAEEIENVDASDDDEATVEIDEEEVPLAAAPVDGNDGMSWWWLLVVVVLGATGYEMYRRHMSKKAKAMEKKDK